MTGDTSGGTSGIRPASLMRSSALMASGTMVSRLLGLVRVVLLAGTLGTLTATANAWSNANTLPNIIYLLLAGGVLNAILVPQLTRAMTHADGGRDFTDRLLTLALTGLVGITVLFTAGAAVLTQLYALDWSGDVLALATAFAYLCMPQVFFYGLYTVLGQILNSQERFGAYMWAPVMANLVAIAGIIVFIVVFPGDAAPGEWTPAMVWTLAGSATLGVVLQALVLLVPVYRSGFRYRPRWGFRGVGLGSASRVAMWTFGIVAASQGGMWLVTNILNSASDRGEDAPGKFIYENAFLLFMLPHSLITVSLVTALYPRLSRAAHRTDRPSLRRDYRHGLRLLGVATVPITVAMMVLGTSITGTLLILNTAAEARPMAWVLIALVLGLSPFAVYLLSARLFYAFEDGRRPFQLQIIITGIAVTGSLAAWLLLPYQWTAAGIGLSQALGQGAAGLVGVWWVRRKLDGLHLGDVARTYVRVLAASLGAAVPTLLLVWGASALLDGKTQAVLTLGLGGVLFFTLYGVLAHRMGVRELEELLGPVLRRAGRLLPGR